MRAPLPHFSLAAWGAVVFGYSALSAWATWPLLRSPSSALGGDLGDTMFVAWVIGWVSQHLLVLATGNLEAWNAMWEAPIFAPEAHALAFSEHFIAQAVQALPVVAVTGNPLLAYNAVLLATIAGTAIASHRFTHQLSGSPVAAVVAGLLATFNHYRFAYSLGHLHTLSVHWWIGALWCLDTFVARASPAAGVAAMVCLIALNLSSNYLLAYSAPLTAAFVVWSMWRHGQLRDPRRWAWLGLVGAGSVLVVAPVLMRYSAVQARFGVSRSMGEILGNSATLQAIAAERWWLAPLVGLALVGTCVAPASRDEVSRPAKVGLLALALTAALLSFGPRIAIGEWTLTGPYEWLRAAVPGFSGLRAPSRYWALALALLPTLAGVGAAWLIRRWFAAVVVVAAMVGTVTHAAWSAPFPINAPLAPGPLAVPPSYLLPAAEPPKIYRLVQALPADAVVVELPFGDVPFEIRYTFFTTTHQRRIMNGYSGVLPPSYLERQTALRDPLVEPDRAWALLGTATHAVVHPAAWKDDHGQRIRAWLESHGARLIDERDGAWLLALKD